MTVYYSIRRTANFRNCWGLNRSRGSYMALVTEIQLGILRGDLDPQKSRARPRRLRRLLVLAVLAPVLAPAVLAPFSPLFDKRFSPK